MPEFKIENAEAVLVRLKAEVGDSEKWRKEKEELIGLLSIMVNMPNLLKEKDTIDKAIDKNRTLLTDVEAEVSEKKEWAKERKSALDKEILGHETRVTVSKRDADSIIADTQDNLNEQVKAFQANAGGQMREAQEKVDAKKEELARITEECDAAENRLRLFKENVAKIPVDV